jgi:hypothetical protein
MGDLFGGPTAGQSQAKKYIKQSVGSYKAGQQALESAPSFQGAQGIVNTQTAHPQSLSPDVVRGMKQNMYDDSSLAFQGALGQIGEAMGAQGLYRSGGTNTQFQKAAGDYGRGIADASRQIDTQAALQRNTDYASAIQNAMAVLGMQQRPYENIGQAYLGGSNNGVWQQPSGGEQAAQGLGSILGIVAGGLF